MRFLAIVLAFIFSSSAAFAQTDYEKKREELQAHIASNFFDPGPRLVLKMIDKLRYFGYSDLGVNLTSLTVYEVGEVLFPKGITYAGDHASAEKRSEHLAQVLILREMRHYFANPVNLSSVYGQVKTIGGAKLLHKVGPTRIVVWLEPAEALFAKGGFNPAHGKLYEDWRTNGCQVHLQLDPGGPAKMSKEECAKHPFVKAIGLPKDSAGFVNKAHWYGFLWRRHLEGDQGLVVVWQGILADILRAARAHG